MSNTEQTRHEVRYALGQLSAQNRHHEFEHLARDLARSTVTRRILPATGPVAAGGDQGRDFETYPSDLPGQMLPLGRELGLDGGDDAGFCCTLQKDGVPTKIAADVEAITARGPRVTLVIAYCEANVPAGARHRLQDEIQTRHGVRLEIFDGMAMAELLAQRHTFWIAATHLHLPARNLPPAVAEWYESDIARWREHEGRPSTIGQLVDIAACMRYAMHDDAARVDLPFWLDTMRPFLQAEVTAPLRQRARYEFVVAHARGLGDVRPVEDLVQALMAEAAITSDPTELESARVVLLFAVIASGAEQTSLAAGTLMSWNAALVRRATELVDAELSPGPTCTLLETLALLKLQPDLLAFPHGTAYRVDPASTTLPPHELRRRVASSQLAPSQIPLVDRDGALDRLLQLVSALQRAPLYPVDMLVEQLTRCAHLIADDPRYDDIVTAIDARTAAVDGAASAADNARDRAMALLEEGDILRALRDMHRARRGWFSGEAARALVLATRMTAELFSRLHLYSAAKYYAHVAASLVQESDLELYPAALFDAAAADFHQGAWLSAIEAYRVAATAHNQFIEQPLALDEHSGFRNCLRDFLLIGFAAHHQGPSFTEYVAERRAAIGLDDLYAAFDQATGPVSPWWADLTNEQLTERVYQEFGVPPFADARARRSIRWNALGVRWSVEFQNVDVDAAVGERVAATMQIILADLALRDPVLLPTTVALDVAGLAHDAEPYVEQGTRGARVEWRVRLPHLSDRSVNAYREVNEQTVSAAMEIIFSVSVLPDDRLREMLDASFEAGLPANTLFAMPFDKIRPSRPADAPTVLAPADNLFPDPHPLLRLPTTAGPGFNPSTATSQAASRYEMIPPLLQATLPALRADQQFRRTLDELKVAGWTDWQILVAVHNTSVNERATWDRAASQDEQLEAMRAEFFVPEERDAQVLVEVFTVDRLSLSLDVSLATTLINRWGLVIRPGPMDTVAVRRLLDARFGYSSSDAPHDDPFA